jgi:hypothetical protein
MPMSVDRRYYRAVRSRLQQMPPLWLRERETTACCRVFGPAVCCRVFGPAAAGDGRQPGAPAATGSEPG